MSKQCTKCGMIKKREEFSFKNKSIGKYHSQCKPCARLAIKSHYIRNTDYYLSKTRKRNNLLRENINSFIITHLKEHPCVDCGEKDLRVLEFDHTGEVPKLKAVSQLLRDRASLGVIKTEISKCEVRCANCHRRKTATHFNWFKNNTRS